MALALDVERVAARARAQGEERGEAGEHGEEADEPLHEGHPVLEDRVGRGEEPGGPAGLEGAPEHEAAPAEEQRRPEEDSAAGHPHGACIPASRFLA